MIGQNTPTDAPIVVVQAIQAVQPSDTPTPAPTASATTVLLAPSIFGPTPTIGVQSTSQPQVLIPVTGVDLTAKQIFVSRIHQLQTGLNFLGFGLILIGLTLMRGKKED